MKNIYKIDFVVIVFSLVALMFVVGYARPLIISPLDNLKTTETEILFSIQNANKVLIDDNIEFTTPTEYLVSEGTKISLSPGKYYWKAVGVTQTPIKTLDIVSKINLELVKIDEENYGIVNSGNVKLNIDIYNGSELVESKELGVGSLSEFSGDKITGEMKDE